MSLPALPPWRSEWTKRQRVDLEVLPVPVGENGLEHRPDLGGAAAISVSIRLIRSSGLFPWISPSSAIFFAMGLAASP